MNDRFKFNSSLFLIVLFFLFPTKVFSQSSLRLEEGSYANPTLIDTLTGRTNLNFTYYGCDPNPKPENIELTTDGDCKLVRNYDLGQSGDLKSLSGTIGEMTVRYKNDMTECDEDKKHTRTLHTNLSLRSAYQKFQEKKCYPTHLLIRDNRDKNTRYVWRTRKQKGLCKIPETRVSKDGFLTEKHDLFNLSANEDGFRIGDHTHYRYNHNAKKWCVSYRNNPYKCGQFPSPLPIAFRNTETGKVSLKGVVSLNPSGGASIYSIEKEYPNLRAMFEDQKNGNFVNVDHTKGRIDFRTWQKNNGIPRSIVSSYEYDPKNPNGRHQRSVNFFQRNVFGVGVTRSWCPEEHCFLGINIEKLSQYRCEGKSGSDLTECQSKIKETACRKDIKLELTRGGSGNICHSCIGITPGICALDSGEINIIKQNLVETDTLKINRQGEYIMRPGVESGLSINYARIAETPRNKGCFDGYARDSLDIFDSGAVTRSSQSLKEKKKERHTETKAKSGKEKKNSKVKAEPVPKAKEKEKAETENKAKKNDKNQDQK